MKKRLSKKRRVRVSARVAKLPNYLKTAAIGTRPRPEPVRGTFGAASEVVHIDPATGKPRDAL